MAQKYDKYLWKISAHENSKTRDKIGLVEHLLAAIIGEKHAHPMLQVAIEISLVLFAISSFPFYPQCACALTLVIFPVTLIFFAG